MQTFHTQHCPEDSTVLRWIKDGLAKAGTPWPAMDSPFLPDLSMEGLVFDPIAVAQDITDLCKETRPVPWRSQPPGAVTGLSLSYNPDAPQKEWATGSFGHPRYRAHTSHGYMEMPAADFADPKSPRGDYVDALSFRKLLPQLQRHPSLFALLNSFSCPLVWAKLRIIDGRFCHPTLNFGDGGFHTDPPSTDILRVNVCVTSNDNFGFQYIGCEPIYPQPGSNLIINSNFLHRPWIVGSVDFKRIHLTLDLLPWLSYDETNDVWTTSPHYGVHPYELVKSGVLLKKS